MKQLTIRNVPDEVAERLARLSSEQHTSVNSIVLEVLSKAVSFEHRRARLERYAQWGEEAFDEFEAALAEQRVVDDALWR